MTLDNSLYYVLIVYTRATKNSMFSLGSFTKDLRQAGCPQCRMCYYYARTKGSGGLYWIKDDLHIFYCN